MTTRSHIRDFKGYGEYPPHFTWPNGSNVAVSLVLNIEDGAELSTSRGDARDDTTAHWLSHSVIPESRNLDLESAFEYGARAGIWRVLRILRKHGARTTALCCAVALQENRSIARALVQDGHEIANHGYKWDHHSHLTASEESALISKSTRVISELTGKYPTTWYSRDGLSPHTRTLMVRHGFRYDSNSFNDDIVHDGSDSIPLPVFPYAGDTNDSALLGQYPTGGAFLDLLNSSLHELMYAAAPRVLSVGLHPRWIGRPAYAGALDSFIAEARSVGAWIATREEIYEAFHEHTTEKHYSGSVLDGERSPVSGARHSR